MSQLSLILAIGVLLLLSALFSMGEAAFLAVNKVRLRHLMQRGSAAARQAHQLLTHLDRMITTILVANNAINVVISVLGTLVCVRVFGPERGPVWAGVILTVVLLIVGEITPKIFAAAHADRVALLLAWPLHILVRGLRPLTLLFTRLSYFIIRVLGGKNLPRSVLVTEEEIKVMIEMGRESGALSEHELRMLHRIFEFDERPVRDIMVPRDKIVAVEITQPPESALDAAVEGHSRVVIYRESLDQIEGILYAKDLLALWRHGGLFVVADLVRPAYVVLPSKGVGELLRDFQRQKVQIAIVQERGRTIGLVTLEDVLEEIVGELDEEVAPRRRRPGPWTRFLPRPGTPPSPPAQPTSA
jgi:CBS domain containing-hemolysin-like protein